MRTRLMVMVLAATLCAAASASTVYVGEWTAGKRIWVSNSAAGSTATLAVAAIGDYGYQQIAFEGSPDVVLGAKATAANNNWFLSRLDVAAGTELMREVLSTPIGGQFSGVAFDSEGKLWVAPYNGGKVYRHGYNAVTEKYDREATITIPGLAGAQYLTFGPLGKGGPEVLWIGSFTANVFRYTPSTGETIAISGGLAGTTRNIAMAYSPNRQWLYLTSNAGGRGGLRVMRPTDITWSNYLWYEDFGSSQSMSGLAIDKTGTIFLSDFRLSKVAVFTGADTGAPTFSHWLFTNSAGPNGIAVRPPDDVLGMPAPEPSTLAALGMGALGLVGFALRRRK